VHPSRDKRTPRHVTNKRDAAFKSSNKALADNAEFTNTYQSGDNMVTNGYAEDRGCIAETIQAESFQTMFSCRYFFRQMWTCLMAQGAYFKPIGGKRGAVGGVPNGLVNSVSHIDRMARVLFPLAFVAFQLFYWLSYVQNDKEEQ